MYGDWILISSEGVRQLTRLEEEELKGLNTQMNKCVFANNPITAIRMRNYSIMFQSSLMFRSCYIKPVLEMTTPTRLVPNLCSLHCLKPGIFLVGKFANHFIVTEDWIRTCTLLFRGDPRHNIVRKMFLGLTKCNMLRGHCVLFT